MSSKPLNGEGEDSGDREARLERRLVAWVDFSRRHARSIVIGTALLTLPLAAYAAMSLGFNSNTVTLVGEELASRQNHEAFAALFPNLENALLVVIDAETPDLARDASESLTAALESESEVFEGVYLPGGGSFFERNGLLYRSLDDLDQFADQLAGVQPILAELEREPSIANFARLATEGLDRAALSASDGERWVEVLDRVGRATVAVYKEFPLAVSWEEVLLRGSSIELTTRRVIVAHPILSFDDMWTAGRPMLAIRPRAAKRFEATLRPFWTNT